MAKKDPKIKKLPLKIKDGLTPGKVKRRGK